MFPCIPLSKFECFKDSVIESGDTNGQIEKTKEYRYNYSKIFYLLIPLHHRAPYCIIIKLFLFSDLLNKSKMCLCTFFYHRFKASHKICSTRHDKTVKDH